MSSTWTTRILAAAGACLATTAAAVAQSSAASTERVSVRSNGVEANDDSFGCAISGNGKLVGFTSRATNLVEGDHNMAADVFVFDRENTSPELASIRTTGAPANRASEAPSLSHTGRYAAFTSNATNLAIKGDHNGAGDVFVYDRNRGRTNRVSVRSDLAEANGRSYDASISADGRFVAFTSAASNLAVKRDRNRGADVFVHDRIAVKTNRVSISSTLREGNAPSYSPSISGDGRMVAFLSYASNLVPDDTNRHGDVFVYDRATRKTTRVSIATDGAQANGESIAPAISADGRFVTFQSSASNLVEGDGNLVYDVFVHDLSVGTTQRISRGMAGAEADGASMVPGISGDGGYVVFQSYASNLVPGDTNGMPERGAGPDVFRYDRTTEEIERVSVGDDGEQADGPSNDPGEDPSITADGSYVCFTSAATNLDDDDTNGSYDAFVRGPLL